ncbi:MAG: 3,4-dihydroxy 2-butanone 4-phosphate synthase/GTP cyclohydrolase II, partial [Kiritimatiellia bacterium]
QRRTSHAVTPCPDGREMNMPENFVVMHDDSIRRVELAMADIRAGRMVILVDDEDRENEGDLVVAAEHCTPEIINFMCTWGRGLICLSLTGQQVERLGLPMMAAQNQTPYNTAFTVSIEAREGVTTGISAADRARTVQAAIQPDASARDVVSPGHMFPLRARDGGVLERVGQTEGSVDLSKLCGLNPSAVICEIMKPDGDMARLPDLLEFGETHKIRICSVADLIKFRMRNERLVRRESEGTLDIPGLGTWRTRLYREVTNNGLHQAFIFGDLSSGPTLVRVQAAPPPWTMFSGDKSPFGERPCAAIRRIYEEGCGVLVFMHLGGGGNDLIQRAFKREFGGEVNFSPPARADALRDLGTGCQILLDLGLTDVRLLGGAGRAIVGVEAYGLNIVEHTQI